MKMNDPIFKVLDEQWLKAEMFAQDFINISLGNTAHYNPVALEMLLKKACAMVGTECMRRMQERDSYQASLN